MKINMTEYEKFLFLSLCLFHDIGHGPYSHVYEIVATAYGEKDHKERTLEVIPKMEKSIKESAGKHFEYNNPVEDMIQMISNNQPLYRLIVDKDRIDKWDYITRDYHYCQSGSVPDIETLLNNLYFDGSRSSIDSSARDALRAFLEAYINNNTSIYMKDEVEICEGLMIRAIASAVENGLDVKKGYSMVDEELNDVLRSQKSSRTLFEMILHNNFFQESSWKPVVCIKPEGYGWLGKCDEEIIVEEASKKEINEYTEKLKLLKLIKLEKSIRKELKLKNHELIITFSPQIDRLKIDNSNITYSKNGNLVYKSIFDEDVSPGLAQYLTGRLYEHHAIRLISSRGSWKNVKDFVENSGGFTSILKSTYC
jgi:HD superfamily phosphohydrolase